MLREILKKRISKHKLYKKQKKCFYLLIGIRVFRQHEEYDPGNYIYRPQTQRVQYDIRREVLKKGIIIIFMISVFTSVRGVGRNRNGR